ncbi:MAPEG family protein [Glaciecola sp. XM2]|uniref:MAPEG family protein n=1 Tax=Glaciecola sp. XM2 TaxID=1914931 RepID=UPI001BDF64C6|nr:MAPEG family protein [Glaciecola sp. XM2]MBT1451170.1 MAPEG family protein [Glaciecola sp. XM2]
MSATILGLAGYIAWLMVLLLSLALYRGVFNQSQKRTSLVFKADGSDVDELGQRLTRAHLNTVESFPFVCGVLLLALATDSTAITNGLVYIVLGARIIQSLIHIASISNAAIYARFVFFLIQFGISAYWLFMIVTKFI